jgi:hypothetical protein
MEVKEFQIDDLVHYVEPQIGDKVNYVLEAESNHHAGETRPAFVVQKWGKECVNLVVLVDGYNDGFGDNQTTVWKTSRMFDANKQRGTWHWPEQASNNECGSSHIAH